VEVKIPIAIRSWIVNRDLADLPEGEGKDMTVAWGIPDGDVMERHEIIVERVFGLKRQEIGGLDSNLVVIADAFISVQCEIGVMTFFDEGRRTWTFDSRSGGGIQRQWSCLQNLLASK
jgi:hypothetical protein